MNDKNRVGVTSFPAVLGTVVAYYRKIKNIGQAELATKMGITASTLSRIENGESAMTIDQLYMACNFLGVKTHVLLAAAEELEDGLQQKGIEAVTEQKKLTSSQSEDGNVLSPAVLKGASLLPFALPFLGPIGAAIGVAALVAFKSNSKNNDPKEPSNKGSDDEP